MAPVDAALGDAAGLCRVVLPDAATGRRAILRPLPAFVVDRRDLAVRCRHDRRPQRRHALRTLLGHPDRVVVVRVGIGLGQESLERALRVRLSLRLGEELPILELGRTFERRVGLSGPRTLEIRVAITCARDMCGRFAGGSPGDGGLRLDHQASRGNQGDDDGSKASLDHGGESLNPVGSWWSAALWWESRKTLLASGYRPPTADHRP